jgi:hypothetical protein
MILSLPGLLRISAGMAIFPRSWMIPAMRTPRFDPLIAVNGCNCRRQSAHSFLMASGVWIAHFHNQSDSSDDTVHCLLQFCRQARFFHAAAVDCEAVMVGTSSRSNFSIAQKKCQVRIFAISGVTITPACRGIYSNRLVFGRYIARVRFQNPFNVFKKKQILFFAPPR